MKAGDIVVVSLDRRDTIVRVLLPGVRRGPYEEARLLYEDLTPAAVPGEKPNAFEQATRERGSGRPTKKERRDVDRLRQGWTRNRKLSRQGAVWRMDYSCKASAKPLLTG